MFVRHVSFNACTQTPYFRHSPHRMIIDVRHTAALSHRTIFVVFTCRSVTAPPNLKPVYFTYVTMIEKEQYFATL